MKTFLPLTEREEHIAKIIVSSAIKIHKSLGPGLLEKIYEIVLAYELEKQGLQVERQLFLPIFYDHIEFKEGLKLDILVEKKVICEVKAI